MLAEILTIRPHEIDAQPQAALLPSRDKILRLQLSMLPMAEAMPEPEHIFTPGIYVRQFTMPKGALVVGKTHLHAHPLFIQRGHALVISENARREVRTGDLLISQPGDKRVVYTYEETVFTTVHANPSDTQDLAELEAQVIKPETPEELEAVLMGALS